MRTLRWLIVLCALTTVDLVAHHGYTEYDRNVAVTLEGTVTKVLWANPHVILTLRTSKGEYAVEWRAATQLVRGGLYTVPVKEVDVLAVTGSINKNPDKRILTLLQEIRRPSDGWQWMSPARTRSSAGR